MEILEEANEAMYIGFSLICRTHSEFPEVTPVYFSFSFHAEQGIRLSIEQFFV